MSEAYRFVSGDDYLELPTAEQTWIIEPLIPSGGLVNIYGQPKEAKKSWMGLNMALAVTNNWDMLMDKFPVKTHGAVAYLQVDTPRSLWMPRIELMKKTGFDLGLLYLADPELVPYPLDLQNEDAHHTEILAQMVWDVFRTDAPLVVFIDTLREVHGGDEDKSTVMRNVVANLRKAFMGSAIVLISHSRKGGQQGAGPTQPESASDNLMDENRGSGYVAGRMDTIIRLTPKFMTYQGRAVGKERFKLEWDASTGLFSAASDPVTDKAKIMLTDGDDERSDRDRAREMADSLHITEEAARNKLRRLRKDARVV